MSFSLTRWGDVDVNISDDVLDGLNDLLEDGSFGESSFKHLDLRI